MIDIYEEDFMDYVDYDDYDATYTEKELKLIARRSRIEEQTARLLLDKILHKYNDDAVSHIDRAINEFTRKEATDYIEEIKDKFDGEIQKYIQKYTREYIDNEITKRLRKIVE